MVIAVIIARRLTSYSVLDEIHSRCTVFTVLLFLFRCRIWLQMDNSDGIVVTPFDTVIGLLLAHRLVWHSLRRSMDRLT